MEELEFYAAGLGHHVTKKAEVLPAEKVERGDFSYSGEGNTARQNAAAFKKDFDVKPRDILNSMLTYGFIDYVYDGVEA